MDHGCVFEGAILRIDGVLCHRAEIAGIDAKRGSREGHIWRGMFSLPLSSRLMVGETLHIRLDDNSQIGIVVTEVVETTVRFRARGKMPKG